MQNIDLKEMLKAGIHFGHRTSRWSPKMKPFIWGVKNNIHLIDIAKTAYLMRRAGEFLTAVAAEGKSALWIGTKRQTQNIIREAAEKTAMPYVIHRWIGGSLSNHGEIKKAVTRLLHLRDVVEKSLNRYGKKEQSMITKERARLEKNVGGVIDLEFPPGVLIVVDAKKERSAVREAIGLGLPIISLVDTNTDPTGIPFVIPANDDSPRSIAFVIDYLVACFEKGQELFKTQEKERAASKKKEVKKAAPEAEVDVDEEGGDEAETPKKEKSRPTTKKTAAKKSNTEKDSDKK